MHKYDELKFNFPNYQRYTIYRQSIYYNDSLIESMFV